MPNVKKEKKLTDTEKISKKSVSKVVKKKPKIVKVEKKSLSNKQKEKLKTGSASVKIKQKTPLLEEQRVRIRIRAYDHRLIDESARKIVNDTLRQGAKICGPIPLPTEIRKWTVNRSTFVHKDARDQYEMRIFKRVIDIINPDSKTIDSLSRLDLPAGVDIEIKY